MESIWKLISICLPSQFCSFIILKIKVIVHKEVILEAFEKARNDKMKETGIEPSVSNCASYISDYIEEESDFPYGERSLRDLYKKAKTENKSVEIKQPQVVDALCKFLGFIDYRDFLKKNSTDKESKEKINFKESLNSSEGVLNKRNVIAFAVTVLIVISGVIYFSIDRQRWMIWEEDHYLEVPFNTGKLKSGALKLYRKNRVKYFKKVAVNCNTEFFNKGNSVNIWYGKNAKKELEYFNSEGLHPETGKTLKPITKYMIDKYICR